MLKKLVGSVQHEAILSDCLFLIINVVLEYHINTSTSLGAIASKQLSKKNLPIKVVLVAVITALIVNHLPESGGFIREGSTLSGESPLFKLVPDVEFLPVGYKNRLQQLNM